MTKKMLIQRIRDDESLCFFGKKYAELTKERRDWIDHPLPNNAPNLSLEQSISAYYFRRSKAPYLTAGQREYAARRYKEHNSRKELEK